MWIVLSLGSAAVQGAISILDKTVLHNFARSPLTFALSIAICHLVIGAVLAPLVPWSGHGAFGPIAWALLSGALWGVSITFLFRAMHTEEVSRTTPIYQTFPIFAALMAVAFLGERLSAVQSLAMVATIGGAILLAVRRGEELDAPLLHGSFLPLVLGSVVAAGAHVTGKLALDGDLPVLNAHALRSLGLAVPLLAWSLRRDPMHEMAGYVAQRSPALAVILGNEFLMVNAGLLLALWALSLGPVTLVTALIATRSFFVVAYSTALSVPFPDLLGEQLTGSNIAVKFAAVALIVAGIAGIAAG